jgi:hypothetical protein
VKIDVDYEVVTITNYRWNGEGRAYDGIVNIPSGCIRFMNFGIEMLTRVREVRARKAVEYDTARNLGTSNSIQG